MNFKNLAPIFLVCHSHFSAQKTYFSEAILPHCSLGLNLAPSYLSSFTAKMLRAMQVPWGRGAWLPVPQASGTSCRMTECSWEYSIPGRVYISQDPLLGGGVPWLILTNDVCPFQAEKVKMQRCPSGSFPIPQLSKGVTRDQGIEEPQDRKDLSSWITMGTDTWHGLPCGFCWALVSITFPLMATMALEDHPCSWKWKTMLIVLRVCKPEVYLSRTIIPRETLSHLFILPIALSHVTLSHENAVMFK